MTGEQLRTMLETILPEAEIVAGVRATGFQWRERKLDPVALVRALYILAGADRLLRAAGGDMLTVGVRGEAIGEAAA